MRGPFVEKFCIEKTHILTAFNVKIASNYAFLFLNKENKILLGPPPPKKRLRDTNVRDTAARTIAMNTRNVTAMYWWVVGYSTVRVFTATRTIHVRVCLYQQLAVRDLVFSRSILSDSLLYNYAGTKVSP